MTNNEITTDLALLNETITSRSSKSGMYRQVETNLNGQKAIAIRMHHTYGSHGTYFPIFRELGFIDNYTNPSGDVADTCQYQRGEYQYSDMGPRNDTTGLCMRRERESIVVAPREGLPDQTICDVQFVSAAVSSIRNWTLSFCTAFVATATLLIQTFDYQ